MTIPSFIEIYDDALTKNECRQLIDYFENSEKSEGTVFDTNRYFVDENFKKSIELNDCQFSNNNIISKIIFPSLVSCIERYKSKFNGIENYINYWKIDDIYSFKKFETTNDGFKVWHTEHGPGHSSKRILVWMYYLNDATSGTDFLYYPTIKPKSGRCVIWPSGWTHIHKSELNKDLKYIISGWVSFI